MGFATAAATAFTIDPTVFVDDDGQAYLHYGGFGRMIEARLGADMISIAGKMQETTPRGFFEAPFLTKRNGVYYEIYAAGGNPATIDWAKATNPLGPWTYGGRVLDTFPRAAGNTDYPTNHAGVACTPGSGTSPITSATVRTAAAPTGARSRSTSSPSPPTAASRR